MYIKRRDIIRLGALGGASIIVPSAAWATVRSSPIVPVPGQLLESLFFDFVWPVIEAVAVSYLKGLFEQEVKKVGRQFGIHSESQSPGASGGGQALVNASVRKTTNGSLLVHGHMIDGGKTAFSHDGTAPSHTHPAMQQHIATIVGGCHSYLKSTSR